MTPRLAPWQTCCQLADDDSYSSKFKRRRREWKRGSLALADAMQYRTFPIPSSSRWENLICPITHLLVGRMVANSTKLDR